MEKLSVKIDFSDFWRDFKKDDNYFWHLLSEKFDLVLSDKPDFLLYGPFGDQHRKYDCIKIFYDGENERPDFNECDFSFGFDYLKDDRHYRLPLYTLYDNVEKLLSKPPVEEIVREKKRFCNFVYSNNKAKERIEFFKLLSKYKRVDSGGAVLNNLGERVGDKINFLKQYKFTISFENSSFPGYTTEKIFQPMLVNSIPIYWGNEWVYKDFNVKSFINVHDFSNFEKAVERIIEIDRNDDLYRAMLAEPYFNNNTIPENIRKENILSRFEYIFLRKDMIYPVSSRFNSRLSYIKKDAIREVSKLKKRILKKAKK